MVDRNSTPQARRDVAFLAGIMLLSSVAYIGGLGLYSDDWALLAILRGAPDQSLVGLYRELLPATATRPLQTLQLVVLYRVFGLEPLAYHVVNTAAFTGSVVLFYICLRALGLPRLIALTVPLVFGLLPHYSTDRFWIAAEQASLSILLYLGSLYADARFVRSAGPPRWYWKLLGSVTLLGSVMAYEITAALFMLNPLLVWYAMRADASAEGAPTGGLSGSTAMSWAKAGWRRWRGPLLVLGTNVLVLAMAVSYKAATTERTGSIRGLVRRVSHALREAPAVAFGDWGIGLPYRTARALQLHATPLLIVLSAAVGVLTWWYLTRSFAHDTHSFRRSFWLRLLGLGLLAFAAGYGVILFTGQIGYATTGIMNRTAMAAALGVAATFVAATGLLSSWFGARLRWITFRTLVATLAASGCLLINTIGRFWIEAARQQQVVMDVMHNALASPAPDDVLLLDGFCVYTGPGTVFESYWGVSGMLRIEYDSPALSGDVIRAGTVVHEDGITIRIYLVPRTYPYGEHLRALHVATGEIHILDSFSAAQRYFTDTRAASPPCPESIEGYGAPIF